MNQSYTRFSRQTLVSGLASVSVSLRNVILVPVLAHFLGMAEYGVWVQLLALFELILSLSGLGLGNSIIRFWDRRREAGLLASDLIGVMGVTMLVALALAALVLALGPVLQTQFGWSPTHTGLLVAFVPLLPISVAAQLLLQCLRAARRIYLHTGMLLSESVAYVGASTLVLWTGGSLRELLIALLVVRLALLVVNGWIVMRPLTWRMPRWEGLRLYMAFGLPLLPLASFSWINNVSDRYVLSYFMGPEPVAVYSVSYALGSLVGYVFSPVFFVLVPMVTSLWEQEDFARAGEFLSYSQKYTVLIATPLACSLAFYGRHVLRLMAPEQYATSPMVVTLVMIGVTAMNLSAISEIVVQMSLKTWIFPLVYGSCSLLNIIGNILLVPSHGVLGAAGVTTATYLIQLVAMGVISRRVMAYRLNPAFLLKSLLAGAMLLFLFDSIQVDGLAGAMLASVGGGILFLLVIGLLGGLERREWELLKSVIGVRP